MSQSKYPLGAKLLLAASAALLLAAVFHLVGYATATLGLDNSSLVPELKSSFRALWFGVSLQDAVIALLLVLAAVRPASVSSAAVVLCSLLPLLQGTLLFVLAGSTVNLWLTGAAAVLAIAGVALLGGGRAAPPHADARGALSAHRTR